MKAISKTEAILMIKSGGEAWFASGEFNDSLEQREANEYIEDFSSNGVPLMTCTSRFLDGSIANSIERIPDTDVFFIEEEEVFFLASKMLDMETLVEAIDTNNYSNFIVNDLKFIVSDKMVDGHWRISIITYFEMIKQGVIFNDADTDNFYFIFGQEASKNIDDMNQKEMIEWSKNNFYDWAIFKFNMLTDSPLSILNEFDGWMGYEVITKSLYDALSVLEG